MFEICKAGGPKDKEAYKNDVPFWEAADFHSIKECGTRIGWLDDTSFDPTGPLGKLNQKAFDARILK